MSARSFSAQDQADLTRLTAELRADLGLLQGQAGRYVRIGQRMAEVQGRGLHGLGGAASTEQWAQATFAIGARQTRKYLRIGARLSEAEVEQAHLGIDQTVQLALAAPPLRPLLRQLGEEGLSHRALSAARRRAAPLLADQEAEALRVAESAARRQAAAEDAEDDEREAADPPGAGRPPPRELRLVRHGLQRYRQRLQALHQQVGDAGVAHAQVEELLREIGQLHAAAQALRGPTAGAEPEHGPAELEFRPEPVPAPVDGAPQVCAEPELPAELEFRAAPAAQAEAPAGPAPAMEVAAPARPAGLDCGPLIRALIEDYRPAQKVMLAAVLGLILRGEQLQPDGPVLTPLRLTLLALPQGPPPGLVDQVLGLLCHPDWERRACFALWFYRAARLPRWALQRHRLLRRSDLPPRLSDALPIHGEA